LIAICAEALALNPSASRSPRIVDLWNLVMQRDCRRPIRAVKIFTVTFV
jgi:hypothetical protein